MKPPVSINAKTPDQRIILLEKMVKQQALDIRRLRADLQRVIRLASDSEQRAVALESRLARKRI